MSEALPTYILSLPNSERRPIMQERLDALPMNLEVHWVDGIKLQSVNNCQYRDYALVEGYNNPRLSTSSAYIKAVSGTKFAHMKKLMEVEKRTEPWVLCMEDDVTFMPWFPKAVEKAKEAPEDIGLVTLYRAHPTNIHNVPETMGEPEVVEGNTYIRGLVCYLVRPAFAKDMLQALETWCQGECDIILEYLRTVQKKKFWLIEAVTTGDMVSELNPVHLPGFESATRKN